MTIQRDDKKDAREILGRRRSIRARRGVRTFSTCLLLLALSGLHLLDATALAGGLDENQLKAAYLYNFARYVEWPGESHDSSGSALQIGVVGGGEVSDLLKKTVAGKTVGDRKLNVVDLPSYNDGRNSHILFIPGETSAVEMNRLLEDLKGTHVFVVADADGFAKRGGIANFIVSDSRVKFAINQDAATRAGLKVSSKLLRLAELVE